MLYALAILLLILWLVGWLAFEIVGAAIHLLVIVAVILFVIGLVNRAKAKMRR